MPQATITLQHQRLTLELVAANIKSSYYAATQYPTIYEVGLNWYAEANRLARDITRRNCTSIETTIGVISALSVRNPWDNNLLDAELCLKAVARGKTASQFKVRTFDQGKHKAIAIALGQNPLDVLTSNKQRSFYLNILKPFDPHIVTVDGHAANIGLGKLASLDQAPGLSDSAYQFFSTAYRQACHEINADSREENIIPPQLQAVTWTYYRVIRGIDKTVLIDAN
jgi:hypothetical protein